MYVKCKRMDLSGIEKTGKEDDHGELQPRDGVHRLRYVRQVTLSCARNIDACPFTQLVHCYSFT
jgi:hypothetical protein